MDGHHGYFIHGGNHIGSAGCINVGLKIDDFVRDLISELGTTEELVPAGEFGYTTMTVPDTFCFIPLEVLE